MTEPTPLGDAALSRRALLGAAAAGTILTLAPMTFEAAQAAPNGTTSRTLTVTGHLEPGAADWVYLPVRVPKGVRQIDVSYTYDKPTVPAGSVGNSCDIGIFDAHGTALQGKGFRGWSGGFRTSFSINAHEATPGYVPGPVMPGLWNVVLGPYQVSDQGLDYSVTVTLTYGADAEPAHVPNFPPQQVAGKGAGWYRGDCHLHTVHSDGKRLPAEVAAGAREAKLDFMVTTDHNTSTAHGAYGEFAGDDLLIITGEEVTTRNGHWLALGLEPGEWIDWRYRARDDVFQRISDLVRRSGGIAVPAHPYCAYVGCFWKFGYENADAVEVWNGPWTVDDQSAVDTWDSMLVASVREGGQWLPAMGNSDAHSVPQVIGLPHTVVRADSLSKTDLMAGIAAGRSWIAESSQVQLDFSVTANGRTAGIGERLAVSDAAKVTVTAVVSGVPNGVVRFITDEGQLQQRSLDASGAGTVTWTTTPRLAAYVRCEVRHPKADGTPGNGNGMGTDVQMGAMAALTNPIFLGRVKH